MRSACKRTKQRNKKEQRKKDKCWSSPEFLEVSSCPNALQALWAQERREGGTEEAGRNQEGESEGFSEVEGGKEEERGKAKIRAGDGSEPAYK